MRFFITMLLLTMNTQTLAQAKKKIKIQYEKRQKVDLGALSVDGKVVAPGDLSISTEEIYNTNRLFKRTEYRDRAAQELNSLY